MIQHRNIWVYYFPTPRQLTVHCPGNEASPPRTQVLVDAGPLINASACHVQRGFAYISHTTRNNADRTWHSTHLHARQSSNNLATQVPTATRDDHPDTAKTGQPNFSSRYVTTHNRHWFVNTHASKLTRFTNGSALAHNCYYLVFHYVIRRRIFAVTITLWKSAVCRH